MKLIVEKTKKFRIGDPLSEKTDMGPLISQRQLERVEEYIQSGIKQGAKLVYGGKRVGKKSFFIEPSIFLDRVSKRANACSATVFAP